MKRLFSGFCLILILGLLAGCMEMLPFGNDGSEESDETVEVDASDEEAIDDNATDEEVDGTEDEANNEEVESDETAEVGIDQCPEPNHAHLTDQLEPGFYIPDCAVLESVNNDGNGRLHGTLTVWGGNWEEIFINYKDFLEAYLTSESLDIGNESAELRANLYEDENSPTIIWIRNEENVVHVEIVQHLPE